jgi:hypothetical protein
LIRPGRRWSQTELGWKRESSPFADSATRPTRRFDWKLQYGESGLLGQELD